MSDTGELSIPNRIGWALLAIQPVYVVLEVVLAFTPTSPYSLIDNTISDLGVTTCTDIDYPFGPVAVCSPLHAWMNGAFVVFGLALVVGPVLSRRTWPQRRSSTLTRWLFVVGGLGSIGTGLVPLDVDLELHVLVSTPSFVALPIALLFAARAFGTPRWIPVSAAILGVATVAASIAFFVTSNSSDYGGLWERAALWPVFVWMGVVGVAALRPIGQRGFA